MHQAERADCWQVSRYRILEQTLYELKIVELMLTAGRPLLTEIDITEIASMKCFNRAVHGRHPLECIKP